MPSMHNATKRCPLLSGLFIGPPRANCKEFGTHYNMQCACAVTLGPTERHHASACGDGHGAPIFCRKRCGRGAAGIMPAKKRRPSSTRGTHLLFPPVILE